MDKTTLKIDEQVFIVNRSKFYFVSKSLIRTSIPYFEELFSSDLLEAKTNKVELDLDEEAFDLILKKFIDHLSIVIKMDFVITLYNVLDYLQLDNCSLSNDCVSYFRNNFDVDFIPVLKPQVTKFSKLLSSGSLNDFICRHFLKIANTSSFLNYPVETIEYICKLDLMVDSENQIFKSIIRWVEVEQDSRKCHLFRLLKRVRWCYISDLLLEKIKDVEVIISTKSTSAFCPTGNCHGHCVFDRTKQYYFVLIHNLHDSSNLRITVFNKKLSILFSDDFVPDDYMHRLIPHDDYINDIFTGPNQTGIRVNWVRKTFQRLSTYYIEIKHCLISSSKGNIEQDEAYYLEYPDIKPKKTVRFRLETGGKFINIGFDKKYGISVFPGNTQPSIEKNSPELRFHAASSLSDTIYVLTSNLEFITFDHMTRNFTKTHIREAAFEDLLLTSDSQQAILFNKLTNEFFHFKPELLKFQSMGKFINRASFKSETDSMKLTSILLSEEIINLFSGNSTTKYY